MPISYLAGQPLNMNKTLSLCTISLLAFLPLFFSCKKGDTGPAGAAGTQGAVGPAGQNGSQIFAGSGAPTGSTSGAIGDYYLDISTGNLYGPKTASGWGSPIVLKGSTGSSGTSGATGAAGSQIYSGATVPDVSVGITGDYYLNKTTYMLYGPKTDAGWGVPVLLQGPQGPEGNANVLVETFTLASSDFSWRASFNRAISPTRYLTNFTRYHDCAFPAVTSSILSSGMVLAFVQLSPTNVNQWDPMPYSVLDDTWTFTYNWDFETNIGAVRLHFYFWPNGTDFSHIPDMITYTIPTFSYKLVALSGETVNSMKQAHINMKDYNAVKKFVNLP